MNGIRRGLSLLAIVVASALGLDAGESLPVSWDMEKLLRAPATFPAPEAAPRVEGVEALCFEGLPFKGRPTRIFAYYGMPEGATPDKPVPGIVLVHGAGGTAFANWVKRWTARGYAAIAFDHDGGIPVGKYSAWERNPDGSGPKRSGFNDVVTREVPDHYMYHAVADTILAHSLLRSMPGVDPDRIGMTGISLGGVVGSVVAGVDPRFKFFVPVYGCGFISENEDDGSRFIDSKKAWSEPGVAHRVATWNRLWDPKHYLPSARPPILWLNGTNDFAFTMSAWQRSYRAAPGTTALSLKVRMPHGHNEAGEGSAEIFAFADSVLRGGEPLAHIVAQGVDKGVAWTDFVSPRPIRKAELHFTRAGGRWQDRFWETVEAELGDGRVRATPPDDALVFYFNLTDDRGLIVSSQHVELPPKHP